MTLLSIPKDVILSGEPCTGIFCFSFRHNTSENYCAHVTTTTNPSPLQHHSSSTVSPAAINGGCGSGGYSSLPPMSAAAAAASAAADPVSAPSSIRPPSNGSSRFATRLRHLSNPFLLPSCKWFVMMIDERLWGRRLDWNFKIARKKASTNQTRKYRVVKIHENLKNGGAYETNAYINIALLPLDHVDQRRVV